MTPDNEQLQQAGSWLVRLTGPGGGLVWMFILAIWGGTVSYLTRLRQNRELTFSLAEWLGEMIISGFAGLLAAYIAMELHASSRCRRVPGEAPLLVGTVISISATTTTLQALGGREESFLSRW